MKYCKRHKAKLPDHLTVCPEPGCGMPLTAIKSPVGGGPASTAANPGAQTSPYQQVVTKSTPPAPEPYRPPDAKRSPAHEPYRPPGAKPIPSGPEPYRPPGARPMPSFGGGAGAPTMFTLAGQIQELEAVKKTNQRRSWTFGLLSLASLLAIFIVLYQVYSRTVLAYAILEDVEITQDEDNDWNIGVSYNVTTPGKVVFDRRSGARRTEKVDLIAKTGPGGFSWSWASETSGIDFRVVYRGGWFRTSSERHFEVESGANSVDIVFVLDRTYSMEPYLEGMKDHCIDFAERIRNLGVDCKLGMVAFGDRRLGEEFDDIPPTSDVSRFRDQVARVQLTGGGDDPESSLEALVHAIQLEHNSARLCLVLITDASCHDREEIPSLAEAFKNTSLMIYVIASSEFSDLYSPLCANGGEFRELENADFETILRDLTRSIASGISAN